MVVRVCRNASGAGQDVAVSILVRANTDGKKMMHSRSLAPPKPSRAKEGGVRGKTSSFQEVVMESSNVGRTKLGWEMLIVG